MKNKPSSKNKVIVSELNIAPYKIQKKESIDFVVHAAVILLPSVFMRAPTGLFKLGASTLSIFGVRMP